MGIFSKKLFSGGKKIDTVLALDIGTEVVKTLILEVDAKNKKASVIGVGRVKQEIGNMQSGAISDISQVLKTSREAIEIAKKEAGIKKIKHGVVGIAGELVKGTSTTVHYERANPDLKINLGELKNIIQQVQRKAYERIKRQIAWETGQEDVSIQLINAAISDVRIDGYKINNPLDFQGQNVSITVFNAYAPVLHLGAIETIINELGIGLISIVAEPYAVARSVDFEGDTNFNAIFIDIGGGTTDIAVVRNGGLEGTKMFALGGRAFTKKLARKLGITYANAEKIKINYAIGKLNKSDTRKIENIFADDCEIWLGGIEMTLEEFSQDDLLPTKILMCGGGSGLPGIKKALMSKGWISNLSFTQTPTVAFLQPTDIAHTVDLTNKLHSTQDVTPLALGSLILDFTDKEKVLAELLRRTMDKINSSH